MKTALALALALGTVAFSQDLKEQRTPSESKQEMKQLDSVTWNLKTHKLIWVVKSGSEVDGNFVPSSTQSYEITPQEAIMAFADEKRGFTSDEAEALQGLLDVLSLYCAESTVWWDRGMGDPVGPGAPSTSPRTKPPDPPKPQRVQKPEGQPRTRDAEIARLGSVR